MSTLKQRLEEYLKKYNTNKSRFATLAGVYNDHINRILGNYGILTPEIISKVEEALKKEPPVIEKSNRKSTIYIPFPGPKYDEIVKDIKEGMEVLEVVKKHSISITTYYHLRRAIKMPPTRLTDQSYNIIADLFSELTFQEIGNKYNLSKQRIQQIYKKAKKAGIPLKARSSMVE